MSLIERLRKSTVQVTDGRGHGAGVAWDADGAIVTNAHVIRGRSLRVIGADGQSAPARIVKHDSERDLALLETELRVPPASIGDSSALRPGEIVFAVGNPRGHAGAVTMGTIHAIGPLQLGARTNWIQADVHLAPGNSGGLLANAAGELIGINTMVMNGLGLAISSNEVRRFINGEVERVRLGVEMIPSREGLVVVGIEHASLAERAHVLIGDVLRCTAGELRDLLAGIQQNGSADIPILRGGKAKTLRVHLGTEARAA
jgi:serine protease Do